MKMLRITQCLDQMMWYADLVGETVPYLGAFTDCYKSREPAGYVNIVHFDDAEIVEVGDEARTATAALQNSISPPVRRWYRCAATAGRRWISVPGLGWRSNPKSTLWRNCARGIRRSGATSLAWR